jgi:hypothetical protein
MAAVRKQSKELKKDQSVRRELRNELDDQVRDGANPRPLIKNPNRDQARGDWDRTGHHHDEDVTRD